MQILNAAVAVEAVTVAAVAAVTVAEIAAEAAVAVALAGEAVAASVADPIHFFRIRIRFRGSGF